jgi:hypothetical protein
MEDQQRFFKRLTLAMGGKVRERGEKRVKSSGPGHKTDNGKAGKTGSAKSAPKGKGKGQG